MTGKNTAVNAIFADSIEVERAVDALKTHGFRSSDVSVLLADNKGTKDFAHKKETKAPEGTTVGVTAGAAIGGTLGWLAGIGMLAVPGVGPLIAAGPIVGALAGIGVGGTVGGLTGALIGLGIPEYEAKRFAGMIKEGRALISVHCDNSEWVKKAKKVLENAGGKEIASQSEEGVSDKEAAQRPVQTTTVTDPYGNTTPDRKIHL